MRRYCASGQVYSGLCVYTGLYSATIASSRRPYATLVMKCQDTNILKGRNAWTHVIEVALPLPAFATSQVASFGHKKVSVEVIDDLLDRSHQGRPVRDSRE
jgi:hypothetical protein